jgi:hypothetical protein
MQAPDSGMKLLESKVTEPNVLVGNVDEQGALLDPSLSNGEARSVHPVWATEARNRDY